jgi:ectoine hydroxylase-related dioxygenase (phytanoyl-CoA dioxygenase family)
MLETKTPELDHLVHTDHSLIADYRKNGHVLTASLLNADEISAYREVINEAAYHYNTEKRKLAERDTYGKAFLQIMNLWEVDEQVRKFTLAKRFAKIAADLMGVENVRLYHDQALYKEPGGGFTPWHQDQYYWPLDTNNTITMWMPLIDITEEMGMLTFASTSQELGFVGNMAISDESESVIEKIIKEKQYPVSRVKSMHAGDASWHSGWVLHSAPGNLSQTTREIMTVIYFADGARITEPANEHQEQDRQRWLGSGLPGTAAASVFNPLLL